MTPFTFVDARADWERFTTAAEAWKPTGFDDEMRLRLLYYLDQQTEDTKAELKRRFPKTYDSIVPVTLPVTRHFVREQAKVFLGAQQLDLVRDGEILGAESSEDEEARPNPLVEWWKRTQERMGLGLRLKRVDAYTTLMRTAGLKFGHLEDRLTAQVVFPQHLRVVMDPEAPMDLDRAWGVALQIASEAGQSGAATSQRFEFWCARRSADEKPTHGIVTVTTKGDATTVEWAPDEGDPLMAGERPIVPIVLFCAHTEELGLFTLEGSDLVKTNRGLNVLASDLQHIAEQQGFGVLVIEAPAGDAGPSEIVRAPNTAISLKDGTTAKFINPSAPIADLLKLAESRVKQSAVLYGIPPGSVSLEGRGVASGIALQIENRPLFEIRGDAIGTYRDPMRRVWDVIRAVHNAWATGEGPGKIGEDIEMRWTPGEIQAPVDDSARIENILARYKGRLCTRVEAIAEDRGISIEEAREVADAIDAERGAEPAAMPDDDPLGLKAKREQLGGGEPDDAARSVGGGVKSAAAEGVVQDTALNGAQVSSLLEIVQSAADRNLPLESARALVEAAFPAIPPELIARILSGIEKWKPKPAPVPPAAPPRQSQAPPAE